MHCQVTKLILHKPSIPDLFLESGMRPSSRSATIVAWSGWVWGVALYLEFRVFSLHNSLKCGKFGKSFDIISMANLEQKVGIFQLGWIYL